MLLARAQCLRSACAVHAQCMRSACAQCLHAHVRIGACRRRIGVACTRTSEPTNAQLCRAHDASTQALDSR